jgi:peptidoglycan/LPS O-acetylase OafA/YrhL
MLGTFRLILALLVALSHANVRIAGLNPGVMAVVCFYLISGYVMTGLIRAHYAQLDRVPLFYVDRAVRIFPQYLAIGGMTLFWFLTSGHKTDFLRHPPGWSDIAANLSIIPLNYYMFNGSDCFTLLPPAWSLGAEVQFYLVIPLLLLLPLRFVGFALGLTVYLMAAAGKINSEIYGYRLLPGVLVFFLLGSMLYDRRKAVGKRWLLTGTIVLGCVVLWLGLSRYGLLGLPYNRETLLGLALGAPLLCWLGSLPQHPLDNRLGDISYGVFLNHFLIQWEWLGQPQTVAELAQYLAASLVLSAFTQFVIERPALRLRHRLRKTADLRRAPAAQFP